LLISFGWSLALKPAPGSNWLGCGFWGSGLDASKWPGETRQAAVPVNAYEPLMLGESAQAVVAKPAPTASDAIAIARFMENLSQVMASAEQSLNAPQAAQYTQMGAVFRFSMWQTSLGEMHPAIRAHFSLHETPRERCASADLQGDRVYGFLWHGVCAPAPLKRGEGAQARCAPFVAQRAALVRGVLDSAECKSIRKRGA
jgi:hypothetical protein